MEKMLSEYFPDKNDFSYLIEKNTHMNLAHIKHEFIHLSDYDKLKPLRQLIKEFRKHALKH
jgi:hypothetical protein